MISESTHQPLLKVAQMISKAKWQAEARAKATHERFNVFTTLLQAHDEVRLHTRFLHCLLDPKGLHDCGSLFLGLFFETLADKLAMDEDVAHKSSTCPPADDQWMVSKEAGRNEGYGQMDLLLEHPSRFGIAIENKIYANEQDGQLAGYSTFLTKRFGDNSRLIYLTLDGKESGTSGMHDYIKISYTDEILAWLEKCLQATYHIVPVNQVLQQYREVVRGLTGKTMNSLDMKKTAEFISQHPEIIRHRQQIVAAIETVRADFLDSLAEGIMDYFRTKGHQIALKNGIKHGRFGMDAEAALVISPHKESPLYHTPFKIWVEKWFDNLLMVGIKFTNGGYKNELSEEYRLVVEKMNLILNEYEKNQEFRTSSENDAWPTGWHELIKPFDDDKLVDLMQRNDLPAIVAMLCEGIECHISQLERSYLDAAASVEGV